MGSIVEKLKGNKKSGKSKSIERSGGNNLEEGLREGFATKALSKKTLEIIHYFAMDTVRHIIRKIDRLDIKDTHALRNSIAASVHTNASGNLTLVRFFYLFYGECVEQGLGRYYGIDADLPKGVGLRSGNVASPKITGKDYKALTPDIRGVADPWYTKRGRPIFRGDYHTVRPFLHSEIKRSIEYVSVRLMREADELLQINTMKDVASLLGKSQAAALAPFLGEGAVTVEYSEEKGLDLKIK